MIKRFFSVLRYPGFTTNYTKLYISDLVVAQTTRYGFLPRCSGFKKKSKPCATVTIFLNVPKKKLLHASEC